MTSSHTTKFIPFALVLLGLALGTTPSTTTSTVSNFAPGVTPPPNPPLPSFNCPRPTQKYCYWEPDVSKYEHYTCWRSAIIYSSSSFAVSSSMSSYFIRHTRASTTETSYTTTWDPTISFSTLCDGHARAPPGATPAIVTVTTVKPCSSYCESIEVGTGVSNLPWPTAPPCRIPEKECASLSHAYASMTTSFFGGWYSPQIPLGLWQPPPCTVDYTKYYPQTTCLPPSPSRAACTIFPGDLTMLYWPTNTPKDLCSSQNGTLTTATHTTPVPVKTKVYEGKTLTSPTAYMVLGSMRNLQTVSISGHRESGWCGPSQPPVTLSIAPESVLKRSGTHTEVFDFRDVNTVPYDVYKEKMCVGLRHIGNIWVAEDCKTVWGEYSPNMVVPPRVTEAVENWDSCDIAQIAEVKEWVSLG